MKKEKIKKEEIKKVKDFLKELKECQKEKEEYLAGWQRARADFLNYKKEEKERMEEFSKYAAQDLILKVLPILDNFNLVEKKLPKELNDNAYIKGLLQIKVQLQDFLKSQGVEEIKVLGQKFDPNFQEVVQEIEPFFAKASEGKKIESGIVIEEVQKGYKIHGKLLRAAKVKIVK